MATGINRLEVFTFEGITLYSQEFKRCDCGKTLLNLLENRLVAKIYILRKNNTTEKTREGTELYNLNMINSYLNPKLGSEGFYKTKPVLMHAADCLESMILLFKENPIAHTPVNNSDELITLYDQICAETFPLPSNPANISSLGGIC